MSEKDKWSKASIIVTLVTFILGLILTPIIVRAARKNDEKPGSTSPELIGKILEGEFEFDEEAFDVRIKSGYLYSTEEVLLLEIHAGDYGIAKLAFRKSEKADIRGAYRYDVIPEESEKLTAGQDSVRVKAEILVTTTDATSYKLYEKTYTTKSPWIGPY